PARTDAAKPAAAGGKAAAGGRATGLTAAVGSVLAKAKGGMRAEQIVAALPEAGMKVDDIDKMRKRVSIVLAARRKHFKAVARGLYKLRG
ncbi:MAG: hypothetical protein LBV15_02745, partial [Planctomycetota bacterium]|nr:hypothetical protein [Planctomycetota bacterium]